MFGFTFTSKNRFRVVDKAVDKAEFRTFGHAAASLRRDVAKSIEKADGPSAPGDPPHTHRRIFLRRALRFDVSPEGAIVGPRASVVGDVGNVLEFGGRRGDTRMEARPFMFPALERAAPRFADSWAGTIGE